MSAPIPSPILALDKISKRFGAIVIAEGVDLQLAEGEALGIIGPNGAGKTTLFGIISGNIQPDSGRVLYAGADITHVPPARRCTMGIGRSFQIPQPFGGMSVFEISLSPRRSAAAAANAMPMKPAWIFCSAADLPIKPTGRRQASRCSIASASNWPARRDQSTGTVARRSRRRFDRARMPCADRTDPRGESGRRLDHLDRACRACPGRQHRSFAGSA